MCGIVGILERTGPADRNLLLRMRAAIEHRGPDGEGALFDREVGLGHRRLSIIDVEGGAQPIASEDGRFHVVFNGEIYNFIELRSQLEACGHRFVTKSDTEVIVHAYEEWGQDSVCHFNGMFAFALWDAAERELFVARDHLGIKPLYYTDLGSRVLFGSEVKALLADPACPRQVDLIALADLFTYRYVPSPRTLFQGVRKLQPGHTMTISRDRIEVRRFWTSVPRHVQGRCERDLVEEYRELLEDAVRLQLRSDVPLGLFLSSGVDSGVLLAIMSRHSPSPVSAFTIGFENGEKSNEVEDARGLAQMFGARHEFMTVSSEDYLAYYERYLWDLEEPVGNETAAAFHFVSRLAADRVKVALTGQGADEPWAGYHRHVGAKVSAAYSRLPVSMTDTIGGLVTRIPGRFERLKRGGVALGERDVLTRFTKIYSFFTEEMKDSLFRPSFKDALARGRYEAAGALRDLQADVQALDPLSQMLYIDTRSNLPDDLLMVGDKMSMANSLEVRVPFLDYRLVEFIESLPPSLKLRGLTGKYLHKRAVEKWLPRDVVWRRKKGFANPIEHWFRRQARRFVEDRLLASDAAVGLYFDTAYIRRMLDRDRAGTEQFRRHIYLLLSFELWHRAFMRA